MKLIAIVLFLLTFVTSAPAAVQAKPTVRVAPGTSSVAISGQGFKAGERVRVLVFHGGVRVVKSVSATAAGSFRLRVATRFNEPCMFSYVSAIGDQGSKATYRNAPAPCIPLAP